MTREDDKAVILQQAETDSSKLQNNEREASLSAEQSFVVFRQAFIPRHNSTK